MKILKNIKFFNKNNNNTNLKFIFNKNNYFFVKKFITTFNKFITSTIKNNNIFWCTFLQITNRNIIIYLKNINIFLFDNLSLFFKYKFYIIFKKYLEIPLKIIVFKMFNKNSYLNFVKFDILSSIFLIKFIIIKNNLKYKIN